MTTLKSNDELRRLLSAHGLTCVEEQGWLFPDGKLPGLRAIWHPRSETGHASGRLDVHALLGQGAVIEECFAGGAGSENEDFAAGMQNFAVNSFHVLLAGLFDVMEPEQVMVERWNIGGKAYTAYIGNFGRRASLGVEAKVPEQLFGAIEAAILAEPLGLDAHWVRTFFANLNNEQTFEALLDNQDWGRGVSSLKSVPWVRCDGYYSVRNFILLRAGPDSKQAP